ncbi:MAG: AmmeMemoRadiSam system protein B [Ignavibacteriales bacterium]|nr:MAG: AmmeMemoRadiSam system protein B [Ignavibacteriales bacterium]
MEKIRKPAVAGYFYPGNPQSLKKEISLMLDITKPEKAYEKIFGIVSPHAGYIYSGKTASYGFNLLLNKNYETVIIISPSHREYFPGSCIYEGTAYETPLGKLKINETMSQKICDGSKTIFRGVKGHGDEHAVEVQLPFLQSVLKDFSIVPVVMGDQGKPFIDELAAQISNSVDEKTLIVASSDLSHYYNRIKANSMDSIVEKNINEFDYDSLIRNLESGKCEACGGGPIAVMMKAAEILNYSKSKVLNRNDSGETSGDLNQVVGYLSAVVYGE